MEDALESARTIDAALAADLRAVGVHDLRELRAVGAAEAWERLLRADLRDTLDARLDLEAAERGRGRLALDPETRERCAAHVRRRVAAEPPRAVAHDPPFRVAPPSRAPDPDAARDRRRLLIALAAFAAPVVAFVVAKLVV